MKAFALSIIITLSSSIQCWDLYHPTGNEDFGYPPDYDPGNSMQHIDDES